jgi:hypothetical protein
MSSIFSDPFFRRGGTLLGGENIDLDGSGAPIAGGEVIGQVKAFQDVNPVGAGERYSNRLVYCVAARYIGNDTTGADIAGKVVAFTGASPLSQFGVAGSGASSALATKTTVSDGRSYGVVDEYIPSGVDIRKNDIVWVVVKGPTTATKEAGAGVTAGNAVVVSNTAGAVAAVGTASAGTVQVAENLGGTVASGATVVRVNLWSDRI